MSEKARHYSGITDCLDGTYELQSSHGNRNYSITFDHENKEAHCTCGRTGVTERYRCVHIVAVAQHSKFDIKDYLNPAVTADGWKLQYSEKLYKVPTDLRLCLKSKVNDICVPPTAPPTKGRPRTARIQSFQEHLNPRSKKRKIKCSRCNTFGYHNRMTCSGISQPNEVELAQTGAPSTPPQTMVPQVHQSSSEETIGI